jgi:hypothetical protein
MRRRKEIIRDMPLLTGLGSYRNVILQICRTYGAQGGLAVDSDYGET